MVDLYSKTGKNVLSTMQVFGDDLSKYGNVGIKEDKGDYVVVSKVIEKPTVNEALSNQAIIGRYVFNAEIIDVLKGIKTSGRELYLTEAFNILAKEDKLLALDIECDRYDVGDKFGFIKANIEYALRSAEIGEKVKEYIKNLAKNL